MRNRAKEASHLKEFTAGTNDNGMRLSRFVKRVTRGLPDSLLYKSFRNKRIKVNGKRASPETRLAEGDTIQLYLNDEFFDGFSPPWPETAAALPPYGIEYEDAGIAILYKPAGVLSHRDAKADPTLLDAFTQTLMERGEYNPRQENTFAPALCNRLDRGTEGLVIAAKTALALREMNEIIRLHLLEKIYTCVCIGRPAEGIHHAFLTRDRQTKQVTVAKEERPEAKPITTEVHIIETKGTLSLCRVVLHTGRTHQIRAHLAYLGTPLLGDKKYGPKEQPATGAQPVNTQLLCAMRLGFAENLPGNSLAHLASREFVATQATLPKWWAAYEEAKNGG